MPISTSTPRSEAATQRRHRLLAEPRRAELLGLLRAAAEPLDVRTLAEGVGLHPNTAREHLDQLVAAGLVEVAGRGPGAGRGRPRLRYASVATGSAGSDGADPYQVLATVLAAEIAHSAKPGATIASAGDRWGRSLARVGGPLETGSEDEAVGRLMEVLDAAGFAPRLPDERGPIELRHCPFRELAEERPDVVCGVHLGLIRGALSELGAPVRAAGLRPFVGPELCLAEVAAWGQAASEREQPRAGR